MSNKRYELAFCERFNPRKHGLDENSSPGITGHYLIYSTIDLNEFLSDGFYREERRLRRYSIGLEIVQVAELSPGQEYVAYLKTFWLRIVQRCWKKVYKARQELIKKRSNIFAQRERQRTGQWPVELRVYPAFTLGGHPPSPPPARARHDSLS